MLSSRFMTRQPRYLNRICFAELLQAAFAYVACGIMTMLHAGCSCMTIRNKEEHLRPVVMLDSRPLYQWSMALY